MEVIKTDIDGVVIIEPKVFGDHRGYFMESFSEKNFMEHVCNTHFVQDNESSSTFGVLRGLHFQKPPYTQAKLVSCTKGRVLDVAVDLRKNSATYGKWFAIELNEESHRQFYIPRGFAHGFSVLSEQAARNLHRARGALSGYLFGGLFPVVSQKNARFLDNEVAGMLIDPRVIQAYEGLDRVQGEALAEKLGNSGEIEKLVKRLMELDSLINSIMEESNA